MKRKKIASITTKYFQKNKIRRKKALRNSMLCQKNSNAFILNLNLTAMVPMLQRCDGIKNVVLVQHIMHSQSKAKHFQFKKNYLLIEGFKYGLSSILSFCKERINASLVGRHFPVKKHSRLKFPD